MKRQHKTFSSYGKDRNQVSGMLQKDTQGGQRDKAQQRVLTGSTKTVIQHWLTIMCLIITNLMV